MRVLIIISNVCLFFNANMWRSAIIVSLIMLNMFTDLRAATLNNMSGNNNWGTAGSWSLAHVPTGAESANIMPGVSATSSADVTDDYTGDLIIGEGGSLVLSGATRKLVDYIPAVSSANVKLYDNSLIQCARWAGTDGGTYTMPNPIILYGSTTFKNTSYNVTLKLTGVISGNGRLNFLLRSYNTGDSYYLNPSSYNTYTGGTNIGLYAGSAEYIHVQANGSFGTGDVTVGDKCIVDFNGSTSDVIDDDAGVYLYGSALIDLNNNNETVDWLFFDTTVQNTAGVTDTWGSTSSSANNQNDTHFLGSGILTVTGLTDTSAPNPSPMTFSAYPLGATTTSILMTATTAADVNAVQYLFENVTLSTNSGYQSSVNWTDTGLTAGTTYTYRVKAKDSLGYTTEWSQTYANTPLVENTFIASGNAWNATDSWDLGHLPTGTESAVITTGNTVTTSATLATDYSGSFTLKEGSSLVITNASHKLVDYMPTLSTANVILYDNTLIQCARWAGTDGGTYTMPNPINLYGSTTFKNTAQNVTLKLTGVISGNGRLNFLLYSYSTGDSYYLNPSSYNTYTGGTNIGFYAGSAEYIHVQANGSFGTGDVTVSDKCIVDFNGSTSDVIDDDAGVYLYGSALIDLNNNNETVDWLFFDTTVQNTAGVTDTWGSTTSSANNQNDTHFLGSGILTVTGLTDTSAPNPSPMTFSAYPLGATTTSISMTATTAADSNAVQYYFENVTLGSGSGYQSSPSWTNTGLTVNTTYTYRVRARDSLGNTSDWSQTYATTPLIVNTFIASGNAWNVSDSWDLGHVPTGTETVEISAGNTVNSSASFSTDYTGSFTLLEGASLVIGAGTHKLEDYIPAFSSANVILYDNTLIQCARWAGFDGGTYTMPNPINLYGSTTFKNTSQNVTLKLTGVISGNGRLNFLLFSYNTGDSYYLNPSSYNTYTGGTNIGLYAGSAEYIHVQANGSFGTGDVTLGDKCIIDLNGTTIDVIDDSSDLYLYGSAQLDLNGNDETVRSLYVDGNVQPGGNTYGSTSSSAQIQNDTNFSGTGVLTTRPRRAGATFIIR